MNITKVYYIYLFIIFFSFLILLKIIFDFVLINYFQSKNFVSVENDEYIIEPMVNFYTDNHNLNTIIATKGYFDKEINEYIFFDVNIKTEYGLASSKRLNINYECDVFSFVEKSNFSIYIDDNKK